MTYTFTFEVHRYEEGRFRDDVFSSLPVKNCLYVDELNCAAKYIGKTIDYLFNDNATVGEVLSTLADDIFGPSEGFSEQGHISSIKFLINKEQVRLTNKEAQFRYYAEKYLEKDCYGSIKIFLIICTDAGSLGRSDGLHYEIRTAEACHIFTPHIHVSDIQNGGCGSIALDNQRLIAGNLSSKSLKNAQKKIAANKEKLTQIWELYQNGISVDNINHVLE